MAQFKGALGDTVKELTGFSLTQLSVAAAVGTTARFLKQSVDEYSAYVESVDKASMFTGMAADEMSRLIQVADDFRVDQQALTNALRMGAQNGFEPTLENIIALADEYNALQNPTQQAEMLQRKFGRSWADIVPLLKRGGAAIRDSIEDIDASLVVTQEAIDSNREYQKAMDDLGDAWMGVKYELGRTLIPALTDVINLSMATQQQAEAEGTAWARNIPIIGGLYQGYLLLQNGLAAHTEGSKKATAEVGKLTEAQIAARDATREVASAYGGWNDEIYSAYRGLSNTEGAADKLTEAQDRLKAAIEGMEGAAEDFLSGTANDLKASLEQTLPEASGKLEEGLGVVDEVFGSTFLADSEKQRAIDELSQKFADGQLDVGEYKAALIAMRDEGLAAVEQGWKDAILEAKNYQRTVLNMPKYVDVEIHFSATGDVGALDWVADQGGIGGGGSGGLDQGRGGVQEGWATGVSNFVVPPGYPNDSFIVGLTSGEVANVTPAGQAGGSGRITIENLTITSAVDYEMLLYQLANDLHGRN
jgi:hypothetical protein